MPKHGSVPPAVRRLAMAHEGVVEGVACKGTSLESTTFSVGKKAFLFVRADGGACSLRLKLDDSQREAARLGHDVGKLGWVKIACAPGALPEDLGKWIGESYRAMAPPPKTEPPRPKAAPAKAGRPPRRSSKARAPRRARARA